MQGVERKRIDEEKKIPEWCEKAIRDWSFGPDEKHSMSEIMTACSYLFQVWLTYHDYRPKRGMEGTRRNCQEAFASKFFEIYRKCKREKRKMIFDDFRNMDIPECE
jgi:hypothetical protein